MSDIIQLLPDSVANQIAAGEVIQRPASAVKELMENSIDAGASRIQLIVKDAGRTLIQIVDNGKGMSAKDAKLSFERHATSKIRKAEDLFALHTMGFRGEALASIAAVAQVELKTKQADDETGIAIVIEGSKFVSEEACAAPNGTSFAMKNLFFNIPARRNFLKSDAVEFRHIIEEFERLSIAHPYIAFSLHHNGQEMYNLSASTGNDLRAALRQRIVALFGNPYNQRLVPVEENTDIVKITGFVVKPEFAKRARGEQFFFLNSRFIKNQYLHHAVQSAFEQLLPRESYAGYFLFLDVDPKTIDVNIHPTKTEVKFEDDRSVYAIIRSSVKRALGQYNISPTLDFEQEMSMDIPVQKQGAPVYQPGITVDTNYNPFKTPSDKKSEHSTLHTGNWQDMFKEHVRKEEEQTKLHSEESAPAKTEGQLWQLHNTFILATVRSGFMIIDQQRAHERILFERYLDSILSQQASSQRILFPETVEFQPARVAILASLLPEINATGFDVQHFGGNSFVIQGIPTGMEDHNAGEVLERMLDEFMHDEQELKLHPHETIAKALAKQSSIRSGRSLSQDEMRALIDELFACELPSHAPDGKPCFETITVDELNQRLKR